MDRIRRVENSTLFETTKSVNWEDYKDSEWENFRNDILDVVSWSCIIDSIWMEYRKEFHDGFILVRDETANCGNGSKILIKMPDDIREFINIITSG